MQFKHIICVVCLLAVGIGYASTGSGENAGTDGREKVKESSAVQLFTDNKRDGGGRVSMKCSIARCDTAIVLRARILKGDFAVQVVRPGLRLVLDNGGSVTLTPQRQSSCCGDWAAGRWNNVSFRLSRSEVEMLKRHNVVSIIVFTGKEENIERDIASVKQGAIGKLIHSVE